MRTCIYLLLFMYCGFIATSGIAQNAAPKGRKCGSEIIWAELRADPLKWQQFQQKERWIEERMRQLGARMATDTNTIYEIPVVFHIVDGQPDTITNFDIEVQLLILNRNYAGINSDSANAAGFYGVRGHSKIRFVLAKRSPDGCDTNGITRTTSNLTITNATHRNIKYTSMGGHDAWDSYNCKYLNIWVGNFGTEPNGSSLLGIATFPDGSKPVAEQGVVIGKSTFSFATGAFTIGRTLVHEVGHFFDLRHIWGDASGCATDDGVDDTPKQDVATSGCPAAPVMDSCTAALPGINFQNYMDYSDDACLTMFTRKQVLRMLASLELPTRSGLIDADNKALVEPEINQYFNMCTNPVFTTNDFYSITVGKGGHVWVGTSRQHIYKFNGTTWEKYTGGLTNNLVWDMKADRNGGVWIAQAGYTNAGTTATTGGLNYFPDSNFNGAVYYGVINDGLPSRYARSLFIDTTRYNTGTNPLVWSAHMANNTAGTSSNGGTGRGVNAASPAFTTIRTGMQVATGTQSVNAVGGNATEVWAISPLNWGKTRILKYSVATNELIGIVNDTTNPGVFPSATFDARAVYFDKNNRKWIGLWGGGFVVNDGANWYRINNPAIIPANARVNANAITGDKKGNVFIGTDSGLIVFKGGSVMLDTNYKRYTKAQGLPDDNVRGICVDTLRKKLLIATQNGIAFWNPPCSASNTSNAVPYVTTANGDLNSPATWCGGTVPPPNSNVIVRHTLNITSNVTLQSLKAEPGGVVTVAAGMVLTITN